MRRINFAVAGIVLTFLLLEEHATPAEFDSDSTVSQFEARSAALLLDAPSRPLSEFAQFQLGEMVIDGKIQADTGKMAKVRELESKLKSRIMPLMDNWSASSDKGTGTLLIQPHLHKLRIVSSGARAWVFTGNSFIDMELILVDTSDGKEISRVMIRRNTGDNVKAGGSLFTPLSKHDQAVIDYVAAIAYEYLADNNELTDIATIPSPTMEDVIGDDGDQASIEFIGVAASEIASKTYDEKLWRQSGELANGDADKQSGIYIKLRAKHLSDMEKRKKAEEIAKLNAELAKQQGREPIEILGVYDSVLKSNKGRKYKPVVILARSGNEIQGKFIPDDGDRIAGTLQNDKIQFHWTRAGSGYDLIGALKIIGAGNKRLEGTWENEGNTTGTWKLIKIGTGSAEDIEDLAFSSTNSTAQSAGIDLSGTYVSDRLSKTGWALKKKTRLYINLKQNNNSIEGRFTNNLDGEITGTINGDKLEFTWWVSGNCGNGTGELTKTSEKPVLKGVLICRSQGSKKYNVVFKPN